MAHVRYDGQPHRIGFEASGRGRFANPAAVAATAVGRNNLRCLRQSDSRGTWRGSLRQMPPRRVFGFSLFRRLRLPVSARPQLGVGQTLLFSLAQRGRPTRTSWRRVVLATARPLRPRGLQRGMGTRMAGERGIAAWLVLEMIEVGGGQAQHTFAVNAQLAAPPRGQRGIHCSTCLLALGKPGSSETRRLVVARRSSPLCRCERPHVQDLPTSNWSNLVRLQRFDCQCASVSIHELDLIALTLVMDEDDGANVAGYEVVCRQVLEQRHRIQFLQHIVSHAHLTLARWIRCHELGWRRSIGEYPHRHNQRRPTAGRLELSRTDKLAPKHAASFGHVGRRRHPHESLAQDLWLLAPKAQSEKELGLSSSSGMIRVQQILDELLLGDGGLISERKLHSARTCWRSTLLSPPTNDGKARSMRRYQYRLLPKRLYDDTR